MGKSDNFLAWHGKQKAIFTDAKEQPVLCCAVRAGDSVSVSGGVLRMQLPPFPAVPKPELSWLWVRATCTQQAVPVPLQCHCAICQAAVRVRAGLVLGEGSEARGLETESVESVAGGQQGSGQALAELRQAPGIAHAGRAPCSSWGAPRAAPAASGRVSSWEMTCGRCGTEELCSFLKEKGAGSQVLSCWAVWEGGGTCCPSCTGEG